MARASRSIASRSDCATSSRPRETAQAALARRAHPAVIEGEDVHAVLGEEAGERLVEVLPDAIAPATRSVAHARPSAGIG